MFHLVIDYGATVDVTDHPSRSVICQPAWTWARAMIVISQHVAPTRPVKPIQRAAGEST